MRPDTKTALIVTRCLNLYWYNTNPYVVLGLLFPGAAETYLEEKAILYTRGLSTFMGELDMTNQKKFVELAIDKYWDEASRWADR